MKIVVQHFSKANDDQMNQDKYGIDDLRDLLVVFVVPGLKVRT